VDEAHGKSEGVYSKGRVLYVEKNGLQFWVMRKYMWSGYGDNRRGSSTARRLNSITSLERYVGWEVVRTFKWEREACTQYVPWPLTSAATWLQEWCVRTWEIWQQCERESFGFAEVDLFENLLNYWKSLAVMTNEVNSRCETIICIMTHYAPIGLAELWRFQLDRASQLWPHMKLKFKIVAYWLFSESVNVNARRRCVSSAGVM